MPGVIIVLLIIAYVIWKTNQVGEVEFIATDIQGDKYKGKFRYSGFVGYADVQHHVADEMRKEGVLVRPSKVEIISCRKVG